MQWTIADNLLPIPKNGPESCYRNFHPPRREWLTRFGTPRGIIFVWEHGGHCTHDGFYMHPLPLAYMAVFRQASLEPGPSGSEMSALPTRQPRHMCFYLKSYGESENLYRNNFRFKEEYMHYVHNILFTTFQTFPTMLLIAQQTKST